MKRRTRAEFLMLLTAAIWGFAFVAQVAGMKHMGPFAFNALRFALGALSLVPLMLIFPAPTPAPLRLRLVAGVTVGAVLFAAASLQQIGIVYTTAGKAGFITGLYVVIVPLIGLLRRQRVGAITVAAIGLAVIGMWLLAMKDDFTIGAGDLIVLAGAVLWAFHVQAIDWCAARIAGIELAFLQFSVCALLSGVAALCVEHTTMQAVRSSLMPLLYGGLCSVGIAYTLQVVAQKDVPPTHAAIILSMESVFAAVGGWLMLSEHLSFRACAGCALMLAGMLAAQLRPGTTKSG